MRVGAAVAHLPQDEFPTALTRLFGATRDKGSLYIMPAGTREGRDRYEGEQPPSGA